MTTTHRITTGIVAAVALATSAAPASARPVDLNTNGSYVPTGAASMQGHRQSAGVSCGDVCSGHGYSATSTLPTAPLTIVRVTPRDSGFDWGDAGIGAAGGLALAMLGVGGGLVISRQRPRRTRPTATMPS